VDKKRKKKQARKKSLNVKRRARERRWSKQRKGGKIKAFRKFNTGTES